MSLQKISDPEQIRTWGGMPFTRTSRRPEKKKNIIREAKLRPGNRGVRTTESSNARLLKRVGKRGGGAIPAKSQRGAWRPKEQGPRENRGRG